MPPLPCVSTAARLFIPTATAPTHKLQLGGVQDVSLITPQYLYVNISAGSDGVTDWTDCWLWMQTQCLIPVFHIQSIQRRKGYCFPMSSEDLYFETSAGSAEFYLLQLII